MKWIHRLKRSFGAPFLILITCIYWTQGFRSLPWMGISYQLKDELKLSPAASQFAMTMAFIPWSIKPVYGILSDCLPISGSRRISYLILSSIISFFPWFLLGTLDTIRMSTICMIGLLTIQNIGTAMADVVIDAMIAEAARNERAEYAGDLQSMSWFAMALGGMFGSVTSGLALSFFHVKGIYLLFSVFPLLQVAVCGFVSESKLSIRTTAPGAEEEVSVEMITEFAIEGNATNYNRTTAQGDECICERFWQLQHVYMCNEDEQMISDKGAGESKLQERYHSHGNGVQIESGKVEVFLRTVKSCPMEDNDVPQSRGTHFQKGCQNIFLDAAASGAGLTSEEKHSKNESEIGTHISREMTESDQSHQVCHQRRSVNIVTEDDNKRLHYHQPSFISKIQETFHKLFHTLQQPAIQNPMLWFFLAQISIPSLSTTMFYYQTNYLHLDASFLGTSRFVGWGALMLGTFLYNQYLKNLQLRKILRWTHVVLAVITLTDVILVRGVNTWFGIPNKLFIVGASALGDAVTQFKFMPFLVLSGQLCEPGIEGTLFALFMSLNNLGGTVSSFFGAALASALDISSNKFENLSMGICIQSLCTLLPVFLLHLLPDDERGITARKSE